MILLTISGPSGSGKTELVTNLQKKRQFSRIITTTTRAKRASEVDGVDYHFVAKAEFLEKIDSGEMIEWAKVNENYYGATNLSFQVAKEESEKTRFPVVLCVCDPAGVNCYRKHCSTLQIKHLAVFITADKDTLHDRVSRRGDSTRSQDYLSFEKDWIRQFQWNYIFENIGPIKILNEIAEKVIQVLESESF